MLFSQLLRKILPLIIVGIATVSYAQETESPFYKYGFPQDEIFINMEKALKNVKVAAKLKLKDVDLSLKHDKFKKFRMLKVVELQNNKIDTLPAGLFHNPGMKYFSSNGNGLVRISEQIGNWGGLEQLKLFNVKLDSFPTSFSKLKRIKNLEIQSNLADTFYTNESFTGMEQLENLLLYRVNIKEFPTGLKCQKTLKNAYFIHCNVPTIDTALFDCKGLKILVLEGNKLKEIPKRILNLKKLEVLVLKNNNLRALPEFISKLPALKTLDLSGNEIPRYQIQILKILRPRCHIIY